MLLLPGTLCWFSASTWNFLMFSEKNACHTASGCQSKVVNLIWLYYFAITTAVLRCRLQFWNIGTRKSTNSFNRILRHSTQVVLKCFFYDRAFPFSARKRKKILLPFHEIFNRSLPFPSLVSFKCWTGGWKTLQSAPNSVFLQRN